MRSGESGGYGSFPVDINNNAPCPRWPRREDDPSLCPGPSPSSKAVDFMLYQVFSGLACSGRNRGPGGVTQAAEYNYRLHPSMSCIVCMYIRSTGGVHCRRRRQLEAKRFAP